MARLARVQAGTDLPQMLREWIEEVGHQGHDLYWLTDGSWIECRTCRRREQEAARRRTYSKDLRVPTRTR